MYWSRFIYKCYFINLYKLHGDALNQKFETRKSNSYVMLVDQTEDNFSQRRHYGFVIVINP